jgi:hypothetical protein
MIGSPPALPLHRVCRRASRPEGEPDARRSARLARPAQGVRGRGIAPRPSSPHAAVTATDEKESLMNAAKRIEQPTSIHRASGIRPATTVRSQAACVRTLLDEVERVVPAELADPMSAQLVEELSRLGSRCAELAAELRALVDAQARVRCA